LVVAWTDSSSRPAFRARRDPAAATSVSDAACAVGAVAAGPHQGAPHIAPGPFGEFVVAWAGYDGETDEGSSAAFDGGYGVRAQRFAVAPFAITNTGVAGKKLVLVDKEAIANKAKVVYVAKDPAVDKGAGDDPADLDGDFRVFYTDQHSSVVGSFVLPAPWRTNKANVAKYVNSTAPAGTGDVKVGVLKTGVVAKVVAKGLGDGSAIDVFGAPPSASGGLTAVLTLRNAGDETERRFCTRFAEADGSTRPGRLHEDVARRREPPQHLHPLGPLQVEHDAALAPVGGEKERAVVTPEGRTPGASEVPSGRLDLDDVRAQIGEDLGAERPRQVLRDVTDPDPLERRARGRGHRGQFPVVRSGTEPSTCQ